MRALWSDRPNCSHNVSQKVERIRRVSERHVGLKPRVRQVFWAEKKKAYATTTERKSYGELSGLKEKLSRPVVDTKTL